jgi:hypothetical protein
VAACLLLLQIPFQLERMNRGQLLLTVPSLMPRQHYQLKVAGSQAIRDAYGLPLEESTAYFFTNEPASDLSMPELSSSSSVSIIADASNALLYTANRY